MFCEYVNTGQYVVLFYVPAHKSYQKYKPLEEGAVRAVDSSTPLSDGPLTPGPSPPAAMTRDRLYVPRQLFMLATLHDKQVIRVQIVFACVRFWEIEVGALCLIEERTL